jgi:tetratricopeptide (TPR) repeat protein
MRAELSPWILLSLVLVFGCAARPGASGAKDNVWRQFQTEHFHLVTDLAEADAVDAAVALERTRAALMQTAWPALRTTRQTQRIRVVVLASEREFERYFGSHLSGIHFSLGGETIVIWGTPGNWESRTKRGEYSVSVLRHEIVHHLAAGIYLSQPRWFAEGLAQFLETLAVTDPHTAIIGRPNFVAWVNYKYNRSLSVKDALSWGKLSVAVDPSRELGLYGLSWAMVHWMYNTQRETFVAYQMALGRGDDADRAWSASFGADDLDEMSQSIDEYIRHGDYREYPFPLAAVEVSPVPVVVTAADIEALHAQLALEALEMNADDQGLRKEVDSHLAAALALEPGNVAALRLLMRTPNGLPKSELITRLRDETSRRPDAGEAWLLLGQLVKGAEREAALRKAIALLPRDSLAYNYLAWHLLHTNRRDEALALATKAALLAPWDPLVLDTYAGALFAVGRCQDAIRVQMRAVDNVLESSRGNGFARSIAETLEGYRATCSAATAAP